MSSDLVERGRAGARHEHDDHTVFAEMADRIEKLEAEVTRLKRIAVAVGCCGVPAEKETFMQRRIEELEAALRDAEEGLRAAAGFLKAAGSPYMGGRTMGRADVALAALDRTPNERDVANAPADEWQTTG